MLYLWEVLWVHQVVEDIFHGSLGKSCLNFTKARIKSPDRMACIAKVQRTLVEKLQYYYMISSDQ